MEEWLKKGGDSEFYPHDNILSQQEDQFLRILPPLARNPIILPPLPFTSDAPAIYEVPRKLSGSFEEIYNRLEIPDFWEGVNCENVKQYWKDKIMGILEAYIMRGYWNLDEYKGQLENQSDEVQTSFIEDARLALLEREDYRGVTERFLLNCASNWGIKHHVRLMVRRKRKTGKKPRS
ncbi:hypothetical protein AA313_de0201079 [Arthrobotrys entomopaga]|nr:hypothetical protein AA313_de0201079 [Arthrobotrys entomopaga]